MIAAMALSLLGCCMMSMPGKSYAGARAPLHSEEMAIRDCLQRHIMKLAEDIGERNIPKYASLQEAARYIEDSFKRIGYEVARQEYQVDGKTVANLEAQIPGVAQAQEIVIIGAHYDTVPGSPGANDNASAVAAMLEIARLMAGSKPGRTVRFVAFVNEEQPYFWRGKKMGSLVYANRCRERKEKIAGMIALETMGCYSDAKGSQRYPFPFSFFYPDTGNFIAFVSNLGSRALVRQCIASFREHTQFPSEGVAAPAWIRGIALSDHSSFWMKGYPAIMVTDTAYCRYHHYHQATDTPAVIDYDRLARVTAGVARVAVDLARAN
ncbi:MAG: M20/M25/M40 family metallo-hydrolase [Candidatus Sumerlaeota bacterium]|nr:M20/M25/M40 family metallo-hydrolase [Candidatus Sumerlaeota bacterium]